MLEISLSGQQKVLDIEAFALEVVTLYLHNSSQLFCTELILSACAEYMKEIATGHAC